MLATVYSWLADVFAQELGIAVVKGYPSWGRPNLEPPLLALELTGFSFEIPARIGQPAARRRAAFTATIFGRHEVEMIERVDHLCDWIVRHALVQVNGLAVALDAPSGSRRAGEAGVQQEAYAFAIECAASWVE